MMLRNAFVFGAALVSAVLAAEPDTGNVGVCYSPHHLQEFPIDGGDDVNPTALRSAMDLDFQIMSQHFTHVRTYASQYYGVSPVEAAAAHSIKLYLGVDMVGGETEELEVNAAITAAKEHPGTVEAIVLGGSNSDHIAIDDTIKRAKQIKSELGDAVKIGYADLLADPHDATFAAKVMALTEDLDFVGLNVQPLVWKFDLEHLTTGYDRIWNLITSKVLEAKFVMTQTGFSTAADGTDRYTSFPHGLDASIAVYNAVRQWSPKGAELSPKFWYQAFDDRRDLGELPYGRHTGFYTHDRMLKVPEGGYPATIKASDHSPAPAATPAFR